MEPRVLKKNVLAARTLVNSVKLKSAVRVANIDSSPYQLSTGQLVRNAMPVSVDATCAPCVAADAEGGTLEHVACLLDTLPADMPATEHRTVEDFVQRNADVFSKSEYDIGRFHLTKHRIDTSDHPPFREPLRRHPVAYLPIIDQHVGDMLANDIIEPTMSPWASNVVIIRKNDGTYRFCVDYRRLNDITRKDSYPLPRIDDCLSSLGGACYFSTLDLSAGYWQTAMDERDADKTAFVTRRGTFRFKVLSFGLANAPALFQRLMDYVLAELTWEMSRFSR